jgi:hypothetical protein
MNALIPPTTMNSPLLDSFYRTIGREISANKLSPLCYVKAIQRCGPQEQGRILQEYTQLRLEQLVNQWNFRKAKPMPTLTPASRTMVSYQWKMQHVALWIFLKLLMLIGFCGGITTIMERRNGGFPELDLLAVITLFVAVALVIPELLVGLAKLKVQNFQQWNYYGALFAGVFSFLQAVQFLKFSYYH